MKGAFGAILVSMLVIGLTGCARPAEGSEGTPSASPSPNAVRAGSLPAMQLVVGTLKLEGGDLAVDATQAAELLPLWKAYLSLNRSDATAAEELEALMAQIQDAMSPEQSRAIAEMELTAEDMAALMQERGIGAMGATRGVARSTGGAAPGQGGSVGAGGGRIIVGGGGLPGGFEGGFPGGARELPPGMAPGMVPEGQSSGSQSDGAQVARMRAAALIPLIEVLIEVLAAKA